ncbi:hypothetical protein TVAG_485180 [Trichomonas vaginalis G3]|uniref:Raptor N-terminal CASPase-like domain-containing protein n=1 Tax=Trichomonas vaginalis (strain ATCC PRA-98 / G3) TaxID=412133 RepID=A2EZ34_TRIV3|nr:regulatory-associateD protein of MTOR family [Trichomonas vaginalis G3]EAY02083.1 hypothetical protein TVAG_485180 [Trichomonas vaginalis G3]KAI5512753.1 regulatory-associateD protein of MTOR family [Trichomonas vaginalis G3]|eukprot:XP_001330536.1 hypothetical protein [Trichomonas vaginalis G3]
MTLPRSSIVGLQDFSESSSLEYSDSGSDIEGLEAHNIISNPIDHFTSLFKLQNLSETKLTTYPEPSDEDYNIADLNKPIFLQNPQLPQKVDCVYLMCSQSNLFPQPDSDYFSRKPMLYMWRNMSNILPSDFSAYLQDYMHEKYSNYRKVLRMFFQVAPTIDKLSNANSLRTNVGQGRILFHYIGFGFPRITENIKALDKKTNTFVDYPIKTLFENLGPPVWFIFDCSHAATVLPTLEETATIHFGQSPNNHPWKDYICFCATGENESLPSDPHLPHDFLTSVLLTPTKTAVLCHILQYYRTTLVTDMFLLRDIDLNLLDEKSNLHSSLQKTLDAITDAIAADILPIDQYKGYFRSDPLTSALFRNYLLAQYLLHLYQVHPICHPHIPDLSGHPLWQQWRTTLDLTIISNGTYLNSDIDLYNRALSTFTNILQCPTKEKSSIANLVLLFHFPENKELKNQSIRLLANYASLSQQNREEIAKIAHFDILFSYFINFDYKSDPDTFKSISYLLVTLFEQNQNYILEISPSNDLIILEKVLFDDEITDKDIKPLIASIVATLLPHNDCVRQFSTRNEFLIKLRTLLETSNSDLTMWLLILERRMFDNYGLDINSFYNFGLHIQAASFVYHNSEYVRAASLSLLPCLLQSGQDFINVDLFGLSVKCGFDCSYLVRYNFSLFLTRFLSIYREKVIDHIPNGLMAHQLFGSLLSRWFKLDEDHENVGLERFNIFKNVCEYLNKVKRDKEYLEVFVSSGLFLCEFLSDDPHPSVSKVCQSLKTNTSKLICIKPKTHNFSQNCSSAPLNFPSFSPPPTPILIQREIEEELKEASIESGGDSLYKLFMKQTSKRGLHPIYFEETGLCGLPPAAVEHLSNYKVVSKHRYEFNEQPTIICYDKLTLVLALGFKDGKVVVLYENNVEKVLELGHVKITSFSFANNTFENDTYLFIGVDNGSIYGWNMKTNYPMISFRSDGYANSHIPEFVDICGRNIVSIRGNCGSIRSFDPFTKLLKGEWNTLSNHDNEHSTAMSVICMSENVCVGFSHGRLIVLDVSISSDTSSSSRVLDITADPQQKQVFKINSVVSTNKDDSNIFVICDSEGHVVIGNNLGNLHEVYSTDSKSVFSFDSHRYSPVMCISSQESPPKLLTLDGDVISVLKESGNGCIVSFHQTLPLVCVATSTGKIIEYSLT